MNLRTNLLLTLVVMFVFFILGCSGGGGGGTSSGGSSTIHVSGTWNGSGTLANGSTYPTTLILNQDGNSVSGTWDGYAITGTVSGNQLTLTFTPWSENGYSYTGFGNATVTDNNMSGNFSITARLGNASGTSTATFTATRSSAAFMAPAGRLVGVVVGAIAD